MSTYSKIPFMLMRIKQNQRLNFSEIRKLQNKKLRVMIKHSYDHVPYYHFLFKNAKLHLNDIKTVEDLDKIPISKKTDFRDKPIENITADNIDLRKCPVKRTSGSTGIPFTIYRDKAAWIFNNLQHYFFQLNCGEKITNKRVTIAGSWMAPPKNVIQKFGIFRTKNISPFNHPKIQLEEIREFNTNTLIAPPSCIVPLAKEIRETDFKGIHLSLIFTAAEFLHENVRDFLTETFQAKLFDTYGATEAGRICRECIEHSYHIQSDTAFIEMTRDGETVSIGEEGEVTVTNLFNFAQPFIRYNLEDFGSILNEECTCGSHYPLMKLTSGRMSDLIHLPDGRVISAHEVNVFLTTRQDIKQCQVIQETTDRLNIKLVKGRGFKGSMIAEIVQMFNKRLGNDIGINVLIVDHIPREKSGKFKLFKSNIQIKIPAK